MVAPGQGKKIGSILSDEFCEKQVFLYLRENLDILRLKMFQ